MTTFYTPRTIVSNHRTPTPAHAAANAAGYWTALAALMRAMGWAVLTAADIDALADMARTAGGPSPHCDTCGQRVA